MICDEFGLGSGGTHALRDDGARRRETATRLAHARLGRDEDIGGGAASVAREHAQEQPDRLSAELFGWLTDGREGRCQKSGLLDVVEANDGHVLGDLVTPSFEL